MPKKSFKLDVVSIRLVKDAPIYSDSKIDVRRQIEGGSNCTLISVITPPRLHSLVGDCSLLAVSPHNVVALFQEHISCF